MKIITYCHGPCSNNFFFFSGFPLTILSKNQTGKWHGLLDVSSVFAETEIFIMTMTAIFFFAIFCTEQVFMSFQQLINKLIIIVISLVFLFVPPLRHYPKVQSKASSGKVPSNTLGCH
jgi:hypothetical protein